jgi:serine/threonine protein kinase
MKCPQCNSDIGDDSKFCKECAAPLTAAEAAPSSFTKTIETPVGELTRGTLFADRYEIIEELGRGGMGNVYRVEDTKIGEEVALKLIKPEISYDKKTIERFSNELKLARKIIHKNVVRMFELMEDKGTHFIAMEYVPGQDLKGLIRQSAPISTARTISIAKQICAGLAEAHDMGVIHRDLKPSNIMIDKEGNARIMDFGIARSLKAKGITGAGVVIGTPEYMSPEQVEAKEVDRRSDIYSLGVILYEMVTGQVPFTGDTPFTIGVKHKSEIPKDPMTLNPQIPADFCRVILTCLEKDRGDRFQAAGDVYSELENIENRIPTTERIVPKRKPLTSREITVRFGLKKLFIPAFVVIVLLAVGGYYLFRGGSEPLNIKIGSTQQITHAPGLEIDPAISPDGKMIAYAAGTEGRMRLYVRQISGERTIALTESLPGHHRWPQWSPDGTRIAFQSSDNAIYVVPALGGIPKRLIEPSPEAKVQIPSWSPDGKKIAYVQESKNIYINSVDGGEPRKIAEAYEPHSLNWKI